MGKTMHQAEALLIAAVLVLAVFSTLPFPANASSPKTLRVPDDYPTIQEAINASAVGAVITVENGTYDGPLNSELIINKSLSIVGVGVQNTTIVLHPAYTGSLRSGYWGQNLGYTTALSILTDNFQMSNLTLKIIIGGEIVAKGDKIQFASIAMTGCTGFSVTGCYCQIIDCSFGGPVHLYVSNSEFSRNSLSDLGMSAGHTNLIRDNTCSSIALASNFNNIVVGNSVSGTVGYTGITLSWTDNNFVYKNQIYGCTNAFDICGSTGNVVVANIVNLCSKLHFAGASNNTLYLNNFLNKYVPQKGFYPPAYSDDYYNVKNSGLSVSTNSWDNGSVGNYWYISDFRDDNGDKIGDAPNVLNTANQDNHPVLERVNILNVNIELPNYALNTTNLYRDFPKPATPNPPVKISNNIVGLIIVTSAIVAAPLLAGTIAAVYYKKRKQPTKETT
jgi:hypothetical protein